MKIKLFLCLVLLLSMATTSCFPQNYFYTSIKLPVSDLVLYAISDQAEDNEYVNSNGILFDFGYAVQLNKFLVIETGAEAYFFNPLTKRYNERASDVFDELDVANRAFSAQVRPVFRARLDEKLSLKASAAFNYRQLYSSGKIYSNVRNSTLPEANFIASASSRSGFNLNLQPAVGLDIEISENWIFGVDISYIRVNWNKSLDRLRFKDQPGLVMPQHRTSDVFLSGRIMFR